MQNMSIIAAWLTVTLVSFCVGFLFGYESAKTERRAYTRKVNYNGRIIAPR